MNHDFSTFSRTCIFFLQTLSLLWSLFFPSLLWLLPPLLFHLSILSELWLLNFLRQFLESLTIRYLIIPIYVLPTPQSWDWGSRHASSRSNSTEVLNCTSAFQTTCYKGIHSHAITRYDRHESQIEVFWFRRITLRWALPSTLVISRSLESRVPVHVACVCVSASCPCVVHECVICDPCVRVCLRKSVERAGIVI